MDAWGVDVMVVGLPEGADDAARASPSSGATEGARRRGRCALVLLGLGAADGPRGVLPALLRHRADPPSLRPARSARDDPRRRRGSSGPGPARRPRRRGLGGGRGLGRRPARWRSTSANPTVRVARGHHDPHRARATRRGCGAGARRRRPHARHRPARAGETRRGLFRIGHMGHLNPPTLLGALATIEAGLGASACRTAPARSTPPPRQSRRTHASALTIWRRSSK